MEKDRLFGYRNTIRDKDTKGRDRLQVYLNQEDVPAMIEILQGLTGNEGGVKFIFHTGPKTNSATGHTFDSTFGFVKAVQAKGAVTQKKVVTKNTADAEAVYNGLNKTIA